jgi:hypothetical protein
VLSELTLEKRNAFLKWVDAFSELLVFLVQGSDAGKLSQYRAITGQTASSLSKGIGWDIKRYFDNLGNKLGAFHFKLCRD